MSAASVVKRRDGRTLRRTTIYFPPELFTRAAVFCAERDVELSNVVSRALEKHLGRKGRRG